MESLVTKLQLGSDIGGNCIMNMVMMGPVKVVLCDPDQVLANIRFNVLQEGKTLVVPSPRLKSGMLRHIVPAEGTSSTSVLWSALNPECLDVLPLLKVFRQRDWKAKRNVCFAGDVQSRSEDQITCREDSSDETKKLDIQGKSVSENDAVGRPFQKRMTPNRRRNGRKSTLGSSCSEDQVKDNHLIESDTSTQPAEGKKTKFRRDWPQLPALYIGGLVRNLRTWELRRLVKDHEATELGCQVKKVSLTKMKYSFQFWVSMMSNSGDETFCNLLGNLKKPINPYVELLYCLVQFPRHTLPAIGLGIGKKLRRPQEHDAKLKSLCELLSKEFHDLLGGDGVFLHPTHPIQASFHNKPLFVLFNFACIGIFNILGLPATAVPMGMCSEEVPIGIQVVGG